MESVDRARVKTAIAGSGQTLAPRSCFITESRGGALMDSGVTKENENNPIS